MTVLTVGSKNVRDNWRDMLDTVFRGGQVVVERNGKTAAVLIGEEQWQVLNTSFQRLQQIERAKRARQRYAERHTPGAFLTEEEYQQKLEEAGLDE